MSKLSIITDKLIYKVGEEYFTKGGFHYQISESFTYFSEVEICSRVLKIENKDDSFLKLDNRIIIQELKNNYYTVFNFVYNFKKILQYSKQWEYVQIRLPSLSGVIAGLILSSKKKVKVYIGGHPAKGLLMAKGNSFINRIIASILALLIKKIVKKFSTYVTGKELFKYYHKANLETNLIISSSILSTDINKGRSKSDSADNINLCKILYVGRISKEKGLGTFAKLLTYSDQYNLTIVGEGPDRRFFEEEFSNYGVIDRVNFIGGIYDRKELFSVIDSMDIFVLPSITEGTPKVLLEAMARGLPIIASNVGGVPSIVEDGYNGFLFESQNDQDLNEKLQILINDREIYKKFMDNGIAFAEENTLEKLNAKLNVYN